MWGEQLFEWKFCRKNCRTEKLTLLEASKKDTKINKPPVDKINKIFGKLQTNVKTKSITAV